MGMTERQKAFLQQFWDLYREAKAPLHYSVVAKKLRVSNISAYDMLRVLKRKGMVASEYLLPKKQPGPGRSTVVFYPTQKAKALFTLPLFEEGDRREWEDLKERTLQVLQRGRDEYDQLLEELLSRIPDRESPMLHTAEVMTAIVLQVSRLGGGAKARVLNEARRLMATGESGLAALAGLPLGLMFADDSERGLASRLVSYIEGYQESLSRLSAESKKALSDFFLELVKAVDGEKA
jgi:energy-coupling factor transport system substrate-specific component